MKDVVLLSLLGKPMHKCPSALQISMGIAIEQMWCVSSLSYNSVAFQIPLPLPQQLRKDKDNLEYIQ